MRSEAGQGRDTAVAERERLVSVQRYVPLPADPLGGRRGSLLAVRNAPDQGNAESYHWAVNPMWYLPIGLVVLCVLSIVLGLMSADSRPGFLDGRFDKKEHSFFHPKD